MTRSRLPLLLAAVALLAAACGPSATAGDGDGPGPESSPGARATGGATATPRESGSPKPGQRAGSRSTGSLPAPGGGSFRDDGSVGDMARAFLRASPATKLVVEVAHVAGAEPRRSALDHLARILRRETAKSSVEIVRGAEMPRERDGYTTGHLDDLSRRFRTRRSGGDTAAIWVAYLNGSFAQASGALGVAHRASEAAIFADRIDSATTALVQGSAIERSVLVHEIGHLLALVNIGYTSRFDHEDREHPGHSNSRGSVMYWAVEDVSIASLLTGGPPDDFDAADRADLADLRG